MVRIRLPGGVRGRGRRLPLLLDHFAALHFMHKNRSAVCAAEQGVMQSFLRLVDKRHVTKYTLFHDQILR